MITSFKDDDTRIALSSISLTFVLLTLPRNAIR